MVTEEQSRKFDELFCEDCRSKAVALAESLQRQYAPVETPDEEVKKPKRKKLPRPGQENWISLRKIFKTAKVPEDVAEIIQRAIEKMKQAGDISDSNRFQLLEFLCVDYLAEVE